MQQSCQIVAFFVFNKTYQSRAVRKAGGGHKVAEDEALRLPWANISRPWRPRVAGGSGARAAHMSRDAARAFSSRSLPRL